MLEPTFLDSREGRLLFGHRDTRTGVFHGLRPATPDDMAQHKTAHLFYNNAKLIAEAQALITGLANGEHSATGFAPRLTMSEEIKLGLAEQRARLDLMGLGQSAFIRGQHRLTRAPLSGPDPAFAHHPGTPYRHDGQR